MWPFKKKQPFVATEAARKAFQLPEPQPIINGFHVEQQLDGTTVKVEAAKLFIADMTGPGVPFTPAPKLPTISPEYHLNMAAQMVETLKSRKDGLLSERDLIIENAKQERARLLDEIQSVNKAEFKELERIEGDIQQIDQSASFYVTAPLHLSSTPAVIAPNPVDPAKMDEVGRKIAAVKRRRPSKAATLPITGPTIADLVKSGHLAPLEQHGIKSEPGNTPPPIQE